jgi:hypothetical protein
MASKERYSADSAWAEQLWGELSKARAADNPHPVADLEDATFRFYLPMARTLAHSVDESVDPTTAEQAAELGLARAVLGWRQQTSDGFRGFARTTIARQLLSL